MNYAPRLSFSYEALAPWISRVSMAAEKVIFYEHSRDPNNVHVHGLIIGFRKDKTTLKNWCKETLRLKPLKTQWTFPEQQKNGDPLDVNFIQYMTQGKYDPKFNKGFTAEEIAEQKAKGYAGKGTDEKPDKNTLYWHGFDKWMAGECESELFLAMNLTAQFERVRKLSYMYMMDHVMLPMPHDIARHKACVMRTCHDYEIPVPPLSKYHI